MVKNGGEKRTSMRGSGTCGW